MNRYSRWLFGTAAALNISVGAALLFLRPWIAPLVHLDPAHGTNFVIINFTGAVVALFGYGYIRLAIDPIGYRNYVSFSVIGKSLAVACVIWAWAIGEISWLLPALFSADVIYALLFLDFLRRTRTP
jgi:hypothetical protein